VDVWIWGCVDLGIWGCADVDVYRPKISCQLKNRISIS